MNIPRSWCFSSSMGCATRHARTSSWLVALQPTEEANVSVGLRSHEVCRVERNFCSVPDILLDFQRRASEHVAWNIGWWWRCLESPFFHRNATRLCEENKRTLYSRHGFEIGTAGCVSYAHGSEFPVTQNKYVRTPASWSDLCRQQCPDILTDKVYKHSVFL